MAGNKTEAPAGAVPSAKELRMALLEKQMEEMNKARKARDIEEKKHAEFAEKFLREAVTDEERAMIRRLVKTAVTNGQLEVMVYSFPCKLTTDGGRAINNNDPAWPGTLKGKARELYDRYKEVTQPLGYKLKAMVVSFPGGMPGDVGFFLNWE
jgi:hypothetical protein